MEEKYKRGASGVKERAWGSSEEMRRRTDGEDEMGRSGGHCVQIVTCLSCGRSDFTSPPDMKTAGCTHSTPRAVDTHIKHAHLHTHSPLPLYLPHILLPNRVNSFKIIMFCCKFLLWPVTQNLKAVMGMSLSSCPWETNICTHTVHFVITCSSPNRKTLYPHLDLAGRSLSFTMNRSRSWPQEQAWRRVEMTDTTKYSTFLF